MQVLTSLHNKNELKSERKIKQTNENQTPRSSGEEENTTRRECTYILYIQYVTRETVGK